MPAAPPEAEWRGKAKGLLRILYERGWVGPSLKTVNGKWAAGWGMTHKRKYKPTKAENVEMSNGPRIAELVLNSHRDFREERSVVTQLFMQRGYLVVPSPRYYPGVVGLGVECAWGNSSAGTSTTSMGSTCARTFWRRWVISVHGHRQAHS
jgi:hypothetical protein